MPWTIIPRGLVCIVKTRGLNTEPCSTPDNMTEKPTKYHEQTFSGSVLPNRIETIQEL